MSESINTKPSTLPSTPEVASTQAKATNEPLQSGINSNSATDSSSNTPASVNNDKPSPRSLADKGGGRKDKPFGLSRVFNPPKLER